MSINVYRKKSDIVSSDPRAVPLEKRMCHEELIDLSRAVCKQWGIRYNFIARVLGLKPEHLYNILNKRQFTTINEFVAICKTLKLLIKRRQDAIRRQFVIPL